MPLNLAVLITTQPGMGHRQVEAYERLAPLVRSEVGCLRYDLHRVDGDDDRFLLLEQWATSADLDAHDAAPHMTEQALANADFRAGPVVVVRYDPEPVA